MHPRLNAFKRHYRKAKDVYRQMSKTGPFGYHAEYTRGVGTQASVITPDSHLTIRFVVLMHRFLARTDDLFYAVVWNLLEEQFGSEIPPEAREAYAQVQHRLQAGGGIKTVYNNEELTPERIYQVIAEGDFFQQEQQARALLTNIAQVPIMGQLFWFQFYDYTCAGLALASLMFGVIQHIERSDAFKSAYGDPDESSHQCIFCLTTTGPFTSEEHIIPESLGNADWLLPKGYVCDACNNGCLAMLDNVLVQHPLFIMQRVHYLPYDKQGRLPEARLGTTTLKKTGPRNILMRSDPGSEAIKDERLDDGWVRFSIRETIPKPFDERLLARALCKVALEILAAEHGQEYVCSERYHAVRTFVTHGDDFHNNLLMRTEFTPEPRISIIFPPLAGTPVEIHIYGVVFLLNLEEEPVLEVSAMLSEFGFMAFPLHGGSSWQDFQMHMVPDPTTLEQIPEQYRSKQAPNAALSDLPTATPDESVDQT